MAKMDKNSDDYETLLKTVWAEARGEPKEGQLAVAHVIWNRAKANKERWGGNSIAGVCRAPKQFSCWNNVSDIDMSTTKEGKDAHATIDQWLPDFKSMPDPTKGADHYYNPEKTAAKWAEKIPKTCTINKHDFHKE